MGILLDHPRLREMLLNPWEWRLVSSLFPPDVSPLACEIASVRADACRRHVHPYREIVMVLAGDSMYIHRDQAYPWQPGVVFFQDAYEPHDDGKELCYEPVDYLDIILSEGRVVVHLVWHRRGRSHWVKGMDDLFDAGELGVPLAQHWERLSPKPDLPPDTSRMLLLSATALLAAKLLDRQEVTRRSRGYAFPTSIRWVDQICAHIRETGGSGVTLRGMADAAGYSTYHFARLFRRHTGLSVHSYIDVCRTAKANELFARGLTHKQVAVALGFSSASGFSRWRRTQRERQAVGRASS